MLLKNVVIVPEIRQKLEIKHGVREIEVHQCFINRDRSYVVDEDEDPEPNAGVPTEYFIAETDKGRLLKVCFVFENGNCYIKTTFEPSQKAISTYESASKPI